MTRAVAAGLRARGVRLVLELMMASVPMFLDIDRLIDHLHVTGEPSASREHVIDLATRSLTKLGLEIHACGEWSRSLELAAFTGEVDHETAELLTKPITPSSGRRPSLT